MPDLERRSSASFMCITDIAGDRWDKNLIGYRGEVEFGVNADTAVQVGGFQLGGHVGQFVLHGLVFKDGLAESHALFGVFEGRFKGRTGHAHALAGNADAPAFQR